VGMSGANRLVFNKKSKSAGPPRREHDKRTSCWRAATRNRAACEAAKLDDSSMKINGSCREKSLLRKP
jgi:hypothetical protein